LPLSVPLKTTIGETVDRLHIAKGTTVAIAVTSVNRSTALWGEDAKEFKPERWLEDSGRAGAKDVQGYRNLLTFADGPRAYVHRSSLQAMVYLTLL
jgi:cytochrome P450